ncbi:hypothetical protein [Microbacterium gilvum]|uniref:Phage tail protein n=1 Tax=Microbacterium gilvum TaxID=1336204 RepID=A0ABP9A5M5_9MICO
MRATINGLSFDEWPRDLDTSFVITPGGLTGWFGGASMRREETARPYAHGAFDAPGFLPARVVGITGTALASSEDILERMLLHLSGLGADGSKKRLTVQDDRGDATWADVRLASCQIDRHPSGMEADFEVQFWAPNPRRFGAERSFPPGTIYHDGNFEAAPTFTITSAPAAYTITSPAGSFVVSGATAGGTHVVDMRTGRVARNGVLMLGVAAGPTWAVPPGPGWVHSINTGTFTAQIVDTFI